MRFCEICHLSLECSGVKSVFAGCLVIAVWSHTKHCRTKAVISSIFSKWPCVVSRDLEIVRPFLNAAVRTRQSFGLNFIQGLQIKRVLNTCCMYSKLFTSLVTIVKHWCFLYLTTSQLRAAPNDLANKVIIKYSEICDWNVTKCKRRD